MGYSEAYCHLCGVSFNISRHRKPGEPELATYSSSDSLAAELVDVELEECIGKGCTLVVKYTSDEDDPVNDPDYEPGDFVDEDPYEWDSEHESDDDISIAEDEAGDAEDTDEDIIYDDFLSRTIHRPKRWPGEAVGAFAYSPSTKQTDTLIPITFDTLPEEYEPEQLEHLPGPTCRQAQAYPGTNISLLETRGCRTAQFLVHKSFTEGGAWKPDGFNEDWEMTANWFLSGVCDGMTSRDCGYPTVWPARGGVKDVHGDNVDFGPRNLDNIELAMPFHPWCFDIFCRQSKIQFGKVNVDGLMKWRNHESSYEDFHEFPRAGDVFDAREQWWDHIPGNEYLAANPLYIPGFPGLLLDAARREDEMEYERPSSGLSPGRDADRLGSLPLDLRLHIVDLLGPKDIASLRAASRAFTRLPNSIWYRLIRDEMPWLWEAWDEREMEHTPSFWTTLTANEIKYVDDVRKRYAKVLTDDDAYGPVTDVVDYLLPRPRASVEQPRLPRADTDWHRVYAEIKTNWHQLKGLRNRQRIWEDVEEIMRRIDKYDR
ncbi:hypothetical protein BJX64DRAFT_212746 [Aspergillus heterothallicus]